MYNYFHVFLIGGLVFLIGGIRKHDTKLRVINNKFLVPVKLEKNFARFF
jgi:hypothetical protein